MFQNVKSYTEKQTLKIALHGVFGQNVKNIAILIGKNHVLKYI